MLVKLDAETPQEALPTVTKARSEVVETRDTVNPRFITEMLSGILRAVGQPRDVPRIHKHTRDDVLWKDARTPWRRSPLWLLLRVALQTGLMQNNDEPHRRYKSFMLFFITQVLEDALGASLSSDTLFLMTAKISRRALKFGAVDETTCLQYVEMTMGTAQQELIARWNSVENHPDPQGIQESWLPLQLTFLQDTELKVSELGPYLASVPTRSASPPNYRHFTSDHDHRIPQCSSKLPDVGLRLGDEVQDRLYLADFELWVQHSLNDWLAANIGRQEACTALAQVIENYIEAASSTYLDMPEDISLMLITAMDLWVALDKCALHHYPLLGDYDPEFPLSVFEPLLLPRRPQMERLFRVEQHLAKRRKAAMPGFPSIFCSINTLNSFPVRYFHRPSPCHLELRRRIEAEATTERSRKRSELTQKRQQYCDWIKESGEMGCEYVSRWRWRQQFSEHSDSCPKCRLRSSAKGLSIDVHEWPLPARDLEAKEAVFELDVPTAVSHWRDTTYGILVDVLSVDPSAQDCRRGKRNHERVYTLRGYADLQKYVKSQAGRLQLASTAKPFIIAHYRNQKISHANEPNVCVNNGLIYSLYDTKKSRWTEELLGCCDVREKCTIKLPAGPYKKLQYAVNDTIHTSNEVIAGQHECPEALTLHEYYAFGTLRAGHRLQWRNIAREITARTLNFSCHETHALFTQAAWQVGPFENSQACRKSHADLEERDFGESLLLALNDAVGTIEGNWQGATAARTFVALAARLLSFSPCDMVREGCLRFLRRVRAIS